MRKLTALVGVMMAILFALTACAGNDSTVVNGGAGQAQEITEGEMAQEAGEGVEVEATEPEQAEESTEVQAEEPTEEHHQDNNDPTNITVRFYHHSLDKDPNLYLPPDAFLYETVSIPSQNFEEIFATEFYQRTGIPIINIWFQDWGQYWFAEIFENIQEGRRLYVNLGEGASAHFDRGTAKSIINLNILERTILSIPDISSFEIFINWQRGIYGSHFSFNHVAYVENGKLTQRVWFNPDQPDDTYTLPGSSQGIMFVNGVALPVVFFTVTGEANPTHMSTPHGLHDILGWETINTGSQSAILRGGEYAAGVTYVNYAYFMFNKLHRFNLDSLGIDDAFISANLNPYLPVSLFRYMGYEVYFADGDVYISDIPIKK